MRDKPSRRDFLRGCVSVVLFPTALKPVLGAAGSCRPTLAATEAKSRVVIGRDAGLRPDGATIDDARMLKLLDRTVAAFFDRKDALQAWRDLVKPGEVVGLKVNCLGGRGISTARPLVAAICERLKQAGIAEKNIVIFDRSDRDLLAGGFSLPTWRGVRCIGNNTAGFEDELAVHGSVGSRLCKTLTQTCDAVINLPVLKDHGITGVTMALKNMYGVIHNPNKYHPNGGDPFIADVNMLEPIRRKVRLTIADATTAVYEGGPGLQPQWAWPFNGVIVGRDPVALDTIAWQLIDAKRKENGIKTLAEDGREPKYIATAADAQHRLGTNDPKRIERLEV